MSRAILGMLTVAAITLAACTPVAAVQQRDEAAAASSAPTKQPDPPKQSDPPKLPDTSAHSEHDPFALAVNVREKAVTGRRLSGATVRLPGTEIDVMTDLDGHTGPLRITLVDYERFPYDIHVSKAGYQTCVIKFGSMIFPANTGLSKYNELQPAQLFVYMPAGNGIATGDECYGGRTQPQTMGPNK